MSHWKSNNPSLDYDAHWVKLSLMWLHRSLESAVIFLLFDNPINASKRLSTQLMCINFKWYGVKRPLGWVVMTNCPDSGVTETACWAKRFRVKVLIGFFNNRIKFVALFLHYVAWGSVYFDKNFIGNFDWCTLL